MKKTNHGSDIVAHGRNKLGYKITLLRKTNKAGEIRHFVVAENPHTGKRMRFSSEAAITPAYNLYKAMLNA